MSTNMALEIESQPGCSRQDSMFAFCSECPALLEQVPETFFLGTTRVGLRCFDVSQNYFVFGSDCGALFPFNRRLQRSATPLRTHYDELVSCVKLYSGEDDILAAGHDSGILVILRFPSLARRKMQQHLNHYLHKDRAISCLEWNIDGSCLYSADRSGTVFVTHINFDTDIFSSKVICTELNRVFSLCYADHFLSVYYGEGLLILNLDENEESENSREVELLENCKFGICLSSASSNLSLFAGSRNGNVYCYNGKTGALCGTLCLTDMFPSFTNATNEEEPCKVFSLDSGLILYYYNRHIFLISTCDKMKVLEYYVLREVDSTSSIVEDVIVDVNSGAAIFILTSDKRVLCLSREETPCFLKAVDVHCSENSRFSLISSIHKTTKLLPFAPTRAILNRLKPVAEHPMSSFSNLTLPVLGGFLTSGGTFLKSSLSECNSQEKRIISSGSTEEGIAPADAEEEQNRSLQRRPRWFDSVNDVSKYAVDILGGTGVPVREGFIADDELMVTTPLGCTSEVSPVETRGAFEEVIVQRTAGTACKKGPSSGEVGDHHLESVCASVDVTPLDNTVLTDIKEGFYTDSSEPFSSSMDFKEEIQKEEASGDGERCCVTMKADLSLLEEVNEKCSEETGNLGCESYADAYFEKDGENEGNFVFQTAYESLMRQALKNKPTLFSNLSDDVEFFDGELNETVTVFSDRGDIWNEIQLPFACSSFCVSSKYIVFCGAKQGAHPRFKLLDSRGKNWLKLRQKGEFVAINDANTLLWRIQQGVAYSPVLNEGDSTPLLLAPHWQAVANEADGIAEVSLTSDAAWYTTKRGQVYAQLRLPKMGILSRCDSPWQLRSITASEVAVWALQKETGRLVVRAGLKHFPLGLDWVEIEPEGPSRLLSISLFGQSGWALDSNYCLWFTNGVDFQSPFGTSGIWLQVCCPWTVLPEVIRFRHFDASVKISSFGVFVNIGLKIFWSSSKSLITGHAFKNIVPSRLSHDDSFEMISAGSLNVSSRDFIALSRNNELFMFRLKSRNFCSLCADFLTFGPTILQICSINDSVFILDSSGCVYVKKSIGIITIGGTDWNLLDTGPCGSPIKSFTVSSCSIWVLTCDSNVYMHVRAGEAEPYVGTVTSWKHVESGDIHANQIRAASSGIYVWIFSSLTGQAWARSCVNDCFPTGKSWIEASLEPGVSELTVGCRVVWCLSSKCQLYKLRGLSASNPAGNYWKAVPVKLKAISVDANDHLWGLDLNNRLVYHKVEIYPPCFDRSPTSLQHILVSAEEEKDFVII